MTFLWIIPFLIFLSVGAWIDLRQRRIPNFVTFSLIIAGLVLHGILDAWGGLFHAALGLAIGGGFFLLFYLLKLMGAGDVKLMAGIGAVLGVKLIIPAIIFTILCGGGLAIFYMAVVNRHGKQKNGESNQAAPKTQVKSVPYGVAITLGTIITLIINRAGL